MAERSSRRLPTNIQLVLEPEDTTVASPGSTIFFNARIITNRPIKLVSTTIKFRSTGRCTRWTEPSTATRARVVRDELYVRCLVTVDHTQEPSAEDPGDVIVHEAEDFDVSSFCDQRVKVELPDDLPDTWLFDHRTLYCGRVKNFVEATVTYYRLGKELEGHGGPRRRTGGRARTERTLVAEREIVVRNTCVPVERFGVHGVQVSRAEVRVGMPLSRGRIQTLLTARDRMAVLGQDLPLLVKIGNDSSKTLRVSLTLFKEYTFKDLDERQRLRPVCTRRVNVSKVRLPRVEGRGDWHREISGFTVPQDCQTSASLLPCTFVSLRFFVRLKLKWLFGSLKCDLEVLLGTHATCAPPLSPTNLERYHIGRTD